MTAQNAEVLERVLTSSLRNHLAEVIFTTPTSGLGMHATTAAFLALDRFGIGQEHVFSVDTLDQALPYALAPIDGTALSRSPAARRATHRTSGCEVSANDAEYPDADHP